MKAVKKRSLLLVLGLLIGVLCVLGVSACKKPNYKGLYYGKYYLNGMDGYEEDTEGTYKYSYLEIIDDQELEFHNVNFSRIDSNLELFWGDSPLWEYAEHDFSVTQRLMGAKSYRYDSELKVVSITIYVVTDLFNTQLGTLTLDFEYNGSNQLKLSKGDINFTFILK